MAVEHKVINKRLTQANESAFYNCLAVYRMLTDWLWNKVLRINFLENLFRQMILYIASDDFFDKIYSAHKIKRVEATRMINSKAEARGKIKELLISNF